jgi:biopolymer transport protein ExbB/TolQ
MGAMGNVMGGIAEALIATAVGILVALPAVIYYNIFQKKGSDVEEQAAALGNVVIATMRGHRRATPVEADPVADRTGEVVGRAAGVEA